MSLPMTDQIKVSATFGWPLIVEEERKPFSNAETFFEGAEKPVAPGLLSIEAYAKIDDPTDMRFCRWCLKPFDFSKQERTIRERGQIRTNLRMADNGSEIACCDDCWSGAAGQRVFIHGKEVPQPDPNDIPNPLLKALAENG